MVPADTVALSLAATIGAPVGVRSTASSAIWVWPSPATPPTGRTSIKPAAGSTSAAWAWGTTASTGDAQSASRSNQRAPCEADTEVESRPIIPTLLMRMDAPP